MIFPQEHYEGLNVTFNVTEDCNIRCKYCYLLDKKPGDLPLEYAEKFIDVLLNDPDPIGVKDTENSWIIEKGLIMDFIGGDALMRPYLLDKILSYFIWSSTIKNNRWKYIWRASISTNGTLFREPGVKEFLNKYKGNISLGVSVDGCPEIHNLNRDNSLAAILMDWDWVMNYVEGEIATKATLNKDSIPFLHKSLKFLHDNMGFTQINMNFIFEPMGETDDDLKELEKQFDKSIAYLLDHRYDLHWGMLSKHFIEKEKTTEESLNRGWCGAGSMPCLGINGKIYPCFRFMPHSMSRRELDFHVGDVWNGFDHKERFQIVRDQTRNKISPKECLECLDESSCAWCIGGAFSENGKFYRQTNICKIHKIQTKWARIYWEEFEKLEGNKEYLKPKNCH